MVSITLLRLVWAGLLRGEVDFRVCPVDFPFPFVGLASPRVNKRDFAFNPKQDPLAPILACGDLSQIVGVVDLQDGRAWNAEALQELLRHTANVVRIRLTGDDKRPESKKNP